MIKSIATAFLLSFLVSFLGSCSTNTVTKSYPLTLESAHEPIQEQLSTKTYINTKYSFVFQYPDVFEQKFDGMNNDGICLRQESIALFIWGSNHNKDSFLSLPVSTKNMMHTTEENPINGIMETYQVDDMQYVYGQQQKPNHTIHFLFGYPIKSVDEHEGIIKLLQQEIQE